MSPGSATITAVTADNQRIVTSYVTVAPALATVKDSAAFTMNGNKQEISSSLYGINYQKLNDLGRTDQWYSKRDIDLMKDMGVEILRVPDGTSANYYLYQEGSLINGNDPRYSTLKTGFEYTSVNGINNGLNGIYLEDIYKVPNELDLPVTFVLNVAFQTIPEITAEVQAIKLQSKGQPIRIEMGNEFYLNKYGK